jgi:hypothetical protein
VESLAFIIANCETLIVGISNDITQFKLFALPLIVHDVICAIGLHGILQGQDPNPADFRCNGQQCVQSMRNVYNDGVGINKVLEAFSDREREILERKSTEGFLCTLDICDNGCIAGIH